MSNRKVGQVSFLTDIKWRIWCWLFHFVFVTLNSTENLDLYAPLRNSNEYFRFTEPSWVSCKRCQRYVMVCKRCQKYTIANCCNDFLTIAQSASVHIFQYNVCFSQLLQWEPLVSLAVLQTGKTKWLQNHRYMHLKIWTCNHRKFLK